VKNSWLDTVIVSGSVPPVFPGKHNVSEWRARKPV